MKKILYSEMNSLGTLLDSFLQSEGKALRSVVKNATLFKFWNKVVGKKFENVSKPVSFSQNAEKRILNVACSSSVVTGELMLYKVQILKKLNEYAKPLGLEIDDLNFSHKIWQNENLKTFENKARVLEENPYKEDLNGFNPEDIELSEDETEKIKKNIKNNTALNSKQQERLFNSIVYDLKVQKFKSNQNLSEKKS